ncbi:MAG: hypothetical protein MH112_04440 [Phenylobacterium sp.]|uniref:hypothetical protein n=1 Tax=Phenylobacterium sp. TaxID=1871053 RepID=UPI0025FE61B3|nr:hypothetical protein [Phenylobacterium sp.]MCG9915595.1 hypothetical protein [Phenylobacterium sp.]
MIFNVPSPSAVASTILARQTCFWGLLRSSTIARRRLRSVGLRWTVMPVRIANNRTDKEPFEYHKRLLWHLQSTIHQNILLPLLFQAVDISYGNDEVRRYGYIFGNDLYRPLINIIDLKRKLSALH